MLLLALASACKLPFPTTEKEDASIDAPPVHIASADGSISALDLTGFAWSEDQRSGEGFVLHELKWTRRKGAAVYLYAKDYAVTPDDTLETLRARDWREYYASIFSPVTAVDVATSTVQGHAALNVRIEGVAPNGAETSIREVYVPIHGHTFVTTASGPTHELDRLNADITGWRASIQFAALR